MQPSRRAFLLGRPAPRTPWQVFCHSLRRVCDGELKSMHAGVPAADTSGTAVSPAADDAVPQAAWTPLATADVRQARALCAEHGIQLALAGSTVSTEGRPVLWVDPARLDRLVREPGPVPRWRAGPGVTLGELAQAGLRQFAGAAPGRTLAAWFADRDAAAWPPGRGDLSGVHAADVLLADGVADTLGPFGADDGLPLRSAALQQLVPALFRMAGAAEAQWCREQPAWPAHYRLDALLPQAPATLNLARMLHGHAGTLAWLESLVLEPVPIGSAVAEQAGAAARADACLPPAQARALDRRVKSHFDPAGVFPELA
ncbi:hypothetical protein [Bordetella genomosp. 11]|uniref:FAD-binding PCMH-type domain-containing protein n=1 Tax=Bordetella genomosp. 11 TaxID=1416808 RepID=A0A261UZJ3_9BORD|nr:hypothetical protein [Bordetella genomosp. 11]OZI67085.1 hypothetical protein CAL28_05175 [Bordetella genomosp. 11]